MIVERRSNLSGRVRLRDLNVTEAQLAEFAQPPALRRAVQDIFPTLSDDDREFLMTGITPEEWAHLTPGDE